MKNSDGNKNSWQTGEPAFFEYHCYMGHDSADAELWYRSHQSATVLASTEKGCGRTLRARCNNGAPRIYRIRFEDGFVSEACEDELFTEPTYFSHEYAPPPEHEIDAARRNRTIIPGAITLR